MSKKTVSGNIVDVLNSVIYPATLKIANGRIADIIREDRRYKVYIIPGFVDSHIHIESSMVVPSEFARLVVRHGTVAVVCDAHEISNVMGVRGVQYMVKNSKTVPLKVFFGAPSCVPATPFETSGATISHSDIIHLFKDEGIKFLGEVMNFQGVINNNPELMALIRLAQQYGKPINGHAPGLHGKELEQYILAGTSTDHESVERGEAVEKIEAGMKILIREGSAARNFYKLRSLISDYPDRCMFCCDDMLPHDLVQGHINKMVKRALNLGLDTMNVLKCASVNPVVHYQLDVGLLQKTDYADFLVIDNFHDLTILKTYINGEVVAENGTSLIPRTGASIVNNFKIRKKKASDFLVKGKSGKINVIEAIDGQLFTRRIKEIPNVSCDTVISDTDNDILKITVVNRYQDVLPAVGFVNNFGFKKGAIASSIAHDSHNIAAVGVGDEDICTAVNLIIENKGGIALVHDKIKEILPLPIAGIMSDQAGAQVAQQYAQLHKRAKKLGTNLKTPFMTLSFMTLLVIPEIKLSDKGLFDSEKKALIHLYDTA